MKDFNELAKRLGTVAATVAIMGGAAAAGVGPSATIEELDARREAEQRTTVERGIDDADAAFAFLADVGANREAWSFDVQQQLDAGTLTKGEARKERKAFLEGISGQYTAVRRVFAPVLGDEGKRDLSTIDGARDAYFALFEEANIIDEETGRVIGWDADRFFDELEPRFIAEVGPQMWAHVQANTGQTNRAPWELEMAEDTQRLDASGFFDVPDAAWATVQSLFPSLDKYDSSYDFTADEAAQIRAIGVTGTEAGRAAERAPAKQTYNDIRRQLLTRWAIEHPAEAVLAEEWGYFGRSGPTKDVLAIINSARQPAMAAP